MAASNCLATRFAGHEHVHFNPTPSQPHPNRKFLMSKIPRNNMWSEVTWPGVMPSLKSVFNCNKSTTTMMMPSGFKPSVLSFSNLVYTGQTLPFLIQPTMPTTTSIMHPFQGIAIILIQSQFGSNNDAAADDHKGGHACNDDYVTDSTKYMKVEGDHVDTESPHETHEFPNEAIKITIECDQTHECHYNTDKDVMWEDDTCDDSDSSDDCDSSDDDCDTCDDDQCDSGDDCVIDFQSCCHDVPTTTKEGNDSARHPLKGPSPPPHKNSVCVFLNHTFSFSSEESGFCDTSPNVEWSEDDDDDECDFNEGLWLELEQKACFAGIPIKTCKSLNKSSNNTKSHHSNHYHQSNNANKSQPPTTLNLDMLFAGSNDIHVCVKSSQVTSRQDSDKNDAMTATVSVITSTVTHDHNHRRCTNAKRVTFKPDSKLAVVHHIIAWKYAYRASRRGPWEQYAADRERFKKRVHAVESVLTPCLNRKLSQVKSS